MLALALRLIEQHRRSRLHLLVAIDGGGGAGKSTLARNLADALGDATIVQMDDFYRPMPAAERAALTPGEGVDRYFDWQRLRDSVLRPLRRGATARYRRYDWETGAIAGDAVEVIPSGVILIEGVYSLRRELRDLYDLTIFVDAPAELRHRRMAGRAENPDIWIDRWMAAENCYLERHRPQAGASLIWPG